jgi:penicillin-binding protein 1A
MGKRGEPVFILSISDTFAQQLFTAPPARLEQTIPKEIAWLTADLMTSVLRGGTASKVGKKFGRPAAGKTGTTNESRDAWFVGFTPQKVTGVWVGHDDNGPMGRGISGGSTAAPIWLEYMKVAHEGLEEKDFGSPPLGIVDAQIDPVSGLLAPDGTEKKRREFFLTGTAPTEYAPESDTSSTGDFLLEQGDE